jgi:hypothetical protein
MVWGCMGWNRVEKLVEVQGRMDAAQYCEILDEGVMKSFEKLEVSEDEQIFQQDNDPKHTSGKADQWVKDNNVQVLVVLPNPLTLTSFNTSGITTSQI